jgi:hypothetical protein
MAEAQRMNLREKAKIYFNEEKSKIETNRKNIAEE